MSDLDEPAFPLFVQATNDDEEQFFVGVTKRELFSMAAMQGLLSKTSLSQKDPIEISNSAVEAAEALITRLGQLE